MLITLRDSQTDQPCPLPYPEGNELEVTLSESALFNFRALHGRSAVETLGELSDVYRMAGQVGEVGRHLLYPLGMLLEWAIGCPDAMWRVEG